MLIRCFTIFPLTALLIGITITTQAVGGDFPDIKEQIDSTPRPVGFGQCATQRTGVWLADGGVVIELQKPKQRCRFEWLQLVIDGERIPLAAADQTFYRKIYQNSTTVYEWYRGDLGKLYFKTSKHVQVEKIQGIWEPDCRDSHCLNEAAAAPAK